MRRMPGMNRCVNDEATPSGTYHRMLKNHRPNLMASKNRPDVIATKEARKYSMDRTMKGKIDSAQFARRNLGAVSVSRFTALSRNIVPNSVVSDQPLRHVMHLAQVFPQLMHSVVRMQHHHNNGYCCILMAPHSPEPLRRTPRELLEALQTLVQVWNSLAK